MIPRNVFCPQSALIPFQNPRPFYKLVCTQQEINQKNRKFEDKRCNKSKRHRVAPHINRIADQSELCVTSGTEYSGNQRRIDGRPHNIIGIDQQHIFQIMHRGLI